MITQRIDAAIAKLTAPECRALLRSISTSLATDCGRAPDGMSAQEGYERHSCVDQVEAIERILHVAGIPIE